MAEIPDAPTPNEWIALIQQDPDQAAQYAIVLRARVEREGIMSHPSRIISLEKYDRARLLLAAATSDPQKIERIGRLAELGRATLGKYPDYNDWLTLIKTNPDFARHLQIELLTKRGLLGTQSPQSLQTSIEIYDSIIKGQKSKH